MKKIIFLLSIFFGGTVLQAQENLLSNGDFEQGMVTWFGNAFNVQTDGGNSFNFSDNDVAPNPFDVNLSHPVALNAGTTYTLSFEAATSVEDDSRTIIAGIGLNEGGFDAATEEVTVTSTLQTYTLTLSPPMSSSNSRALFDLGGDEGVLVIDNVSLIEGTTGDPVVFLPVDFELDAGLYDFVGFEGAASAIEGNPDATGVNTSPNVMRTIKTEGAQFFAGTFLNLDEPIDFSGFEGISIDTYSPKDGIPVRIALENQSTVDQIFVDVNTTTINEWETLIADFSALIDPEIEYNRIIVFFEFIEDLPGDGSTYYFDNMRAENPLSTGDFATVDVSASPNPVDTNWNVRSNEVITQISIHNMLGQKVMEVTPEDIQAQMDLSHLGSQIYLATISTVKGSKTIKVIKR